MKSFFSLLLLACIWMGLSLLSSCKSKQETPTEAYMQMDSVASADTVVADTLATDTLQAAPPKKADELFDDFVYAFMKNRRFQRNRVRFPLPYTVDGKQQALTRQAWKHDPMFSNREVYTLIFDNKKGMRVAKDTSLRSVVVEELDLEDLRVKSYAFERNANEWQLVRLDHEAMEKSVNSEFYDFYHRFSTDTDFQQQHIANPLEFSTIDEETDETIAGFISPDQWMDFAPELPTTQLTNILYGQTFLNSKMRVLTITSLSGGMNSSLTFKKVSGKWMLTKLEN